MSEQRSYSRIDTRMRAYARRSSSLDTPRLFRHHSPTVATDLRTVKLPEGVAGFLQEMDRKLDTILSLLSRDQLRDDFPIDFEILEISGAGMKFRSSEPVAIEDIYEVVMILDRIPLRMACSKGHVVGRDEETGLYRFEFVNISENDLESVIQFVFQQQREHIRSSRR